MLATQYGEESLTEEINSSGNGGQLRREGHAYIVRKREREREREKWKERKSEKRGRGSTQRREWIGGDVSDENPDSVNFPVDGFPWRKFLDADPQGVERKRNADPIVSPLFSVEIPRRDPPRA